MRRGRGRRPRELARRLALAGSAALLAACTAAPVGDPDPASERGAQTVELLRYARRLVDLAAPELARERRDLERVYRDAGHPEARLRLALLLLEARSPDAAAARERARELLEAHLADADAPGRDLAVYVHHRLAEEARAAHAAQAQAAADQISVAGLHRELAEVSARLERERHRRAQLERQLDALKAIEREIKQRAAPGMPAQ